MKCILMNKNTEVLVAEYDGAIKSFTKVIEVKNIDYAPYIIAISFDGDIYDDAFRSVLSNWFKGRGIPAWRDKLDLLLHRLNIDTPSELLDKAFGLSLSDQYWIKPYDSVVSYDDINFFDNDFDYVEFLEASLSLNGKVVNNESSLKTPNNTTDGMLKKAWIIDDGVRYLLKSGYKNEVLQPFNEAIASLICERLGFRCVKYELDTYKDIVVSKCPCFITKDTEFITAYQILSKKKRYNNSQDYEEYIKILEDNGISNAREELENMFILDFLMMNEDRHLNNFGIIRDVNTLKWISVAPIFDNGQSFNIKDYNKDEIIVTSSGRFFWDVKEFDEIIKVVKNIKRIDVSKLEDIPDIFNEMLNKYQKITNMSDNRIYRLCVLLQRQINKLKKLISST